MSEKTINAILTHLPAEQVSAAHTWWAREMPGAEVLVVYGGDEDEFRRVSVPEKVFVEGDAHRTLDHQRERQSYSEAMRSVVTWLAGRDYRYVNFMEFDVRPLDRQWTDRLEEAIEADGAGVLAHDLQRVDGTANVHFLNHHHDPAFVDFWRSVSVREQIDVVLSMLGCHSFWRRDAFEAVAAVPDPFPIYLELSMPTLAHHLGFRVRPMPGDGSSFRPAGEFSGAEIEAARAGGALAAHPAKGGWE